MRLWLHLGSAKTGTSSIQSALAGQRHRLREHGILFPDVGPNLHHNMLAVPFQRTPSRLYAHQWRGRFGELRQHAAEWWGHVAAEFRTSGCTTLLVSAEHMYSLDPPHVDDVAAMLDDLLPQVSERRMLVYVRRPSRQYASRLQQHVKANHTLLGKLRVRHHGRLVAWSRVGALEIAEFSPDRLHDGDVVSDVVHRLGLPSTPGAGPRTNTSMSAEAMQELQDFRRASFPHRKNIFTPASREHVQRVLDVDAALAAPSPARLVPAHADHVDFGHPDLDRVREDFGFELAGMDYRRFGQEFPHHHVDARDIRDIMAIDEDRLQELHEQVEFHSSGATGSAGGVASRRVDGQRASGAHDDGRVAAVSAAADTAATPSTPPERGDPGPLTPAQVRTAALHGEISWFEQQLADERHDHDDDRQRLARTATRRDTLRRRLERAEHDNEVLRGELEVLRRELESARLDLQAYESSTSWRITAPLRHVARRISDLSRRARS